MAEFELVSTKKSDGHILEQAAHAIKTQPEHLIKVIIRFKTELEAFKTKLKSIPLD
jgi:hypothetical protein